MKIESRAGMLKIYVGESDKVHGPARCLKKSCLRRENPTVQENAASAFQNSIAHLCSQ